jgi:predicted dinucleotide-binding enzyme
MGQAIAAVAGRGGHTVQLLGQGDAATEVTGDIVVLAVPYPAVAEVIAQRGESLAGRIVVDITNPLNFETFDSLVVPAHSSATAEIAAALPQSRVLKAFNTTFAATLSAGTVGPLPTTVLIAGDDTDVAISGDIVVLAVPYPAVSDVIAQRGASLAGKVVVDISNPLNFETFDSLAVPADSSATAELAAALPSSKVLKAFNTNFAATLASKAVGPNPTTVLIAGDDADAKAQLTAVVTAGGLQAVDAGSLRRAAELEALGFLQITLAASEQVGWTGGFGIVR